MSPTLSHLAREIATSSLHDHVVHWLRTIPGLPPIVQTVHILSVACVMASIAMIDLRVLGLAVPSQRPREMVHRLMPWMWTSLILLLLSGGMFFVTRPARYFANPVFAIKVSLLIPAVILSALLARMHRNQEESRPSLKIIAGVSLLLWIGVVLAGRWIAYADYLFPPE